MSTSVETITAPASYLHRRSMGEVSLPPNYEDAEVYELNQMRPSSSADSLPRYSTVYEDEAGFSSSAAGSSSSSSSSSSSAGFHATKCFQIESRGHPLIALPMPPRPDPIYIFNVGPAGEVEQAEYVSVRAARNSGSCFLARADDAEHAPLCTTTYRCGPNRPPKIKLLSQVGAGGCEDDKDQDSNSSNSSSSEEEIVLDCKGAFTRAVVMRTPFGSFEWRYSTRAERRAEGPGVDSLLVLDRTTAVSLAGGKTEVRRRKVGQLVRSGDLRTQGTGRSTAGNGGRLMLDLREWAADAKGELEQVEVLLVASCVSLLKKEVDRRRFHQTLVLMAGASGGP